MARRGKRASSSTRTDWSEWLSRWRRQQETYLPQREARFDAMLSFLEVALPPEFHAVDLASGPGAISNRILRRFPRARCTAIDYDPVLLRLGRETLGAAGGRLVWIDADLRTRDWTSKVPARPVDAVLSTTALHWLRERELAGLYRQIRSLLRPGGIFLNGDQMVYPRSESSLREWTRAARARSADRQMALYGGERWDDWWAALIREPTLAPEFEERARRYPKEHGAEPELPFATHLRLLRAAGFAEVDVLWQQYDNRVVAAIAPRRAREGRPVGTRSR